MSARAVTVLGSTSVAGTRWLRTALCCWHVRQGLPGADRLHQAADTHPGAARAGRPLQPWLPAGA